MTATPRRAMPARTAAMQDYLSELAGINRDTALPRRSRPQRALHCLETRLCFGCPDDEHRRTGDEFEQPARRAAHEDLWIVEAAS